ncbi:metallophosphoesterase [Candidatus Dojkabacteria bacterium]|nr:metallophosphoesterase [Candidatus Dojkabacteria bacterium]
MDIRKSSSRIVVMVFWIFLAIAGIVITVAAVTKQVLDTRGKAETTISTIEPWNFVVIGDTQAAKEYIYYDTYFSKIFEANPEILFHVGDFDWSLPTENPLKGILSVQYRRFDDSDPDNDYPVEIHVAPGNHDDGCGSTLYPHYINGICYGKHTTDAAGKCEHLSWSNHLPFNTEVQNVQGYCDFDSQDHQYVFERGGIRFIMLERPFIDGAEAKRAWFEEQVCKKNSASISIAFLHENDFHNLKLLLDGLPCGTNHNLKAVFMGHGHNFEYEEYKGVHMLEVSGMVYCSRREEGTECEGCDGCDFINVMVNSDKISVVRTQYDLGSIDYEKEIFSVTGSFSEYNHPGYAQDDSSDGDSAAEKKTYLYGLSSGIHLVSFPFEAEDSKVSKLASVIFDSLSTNKDITISSFESGRWVSYRVKNGEVYSEKDFDIEPGKGYLVRLNEKVDFKLEGRELSSSSYVDLNEGWNLVGFWGDGYNSKKVLSRLEELGVESKMVSTFQEGRYRTFIVDGGNEYGEVFVIEGSKGYFVNVDKSAKVKWDW